MAGLVESQPERALQLARAMDDPWYRCQALSHIARHTDSPSLRNAILDEAFAAATALHEPNRLVTVSAWPLKVLALTGEHSRADIEAKRLTAIIATEPSPVRRADALYVLLGAVIHATRVVTLPVLQAFAAACLQPLLNGKRNRKGEYLLAGCFPAVDRLAPELAQYAVAQLTPSRAAQALNLVKSARQSSLAQIIDWPNI